MFVVLLLLILVLWYCITVNAFAIALLQGLQSGNDSRLRVCMVRAAAIVASMVVRQRQNAAEDERKNRQPRSKF